MATITATYEGDLCCTATHGPSQAKLSTDAPKDNEGLGRVMPIHGTAGSMRSGLIAQTDPGVLDRA